MCNKIIVLNSIEHQHKHNKHRHLVMMKKKGTKFKETDHTSDTMQERNPQKPLEYPIINLVPYANVIYIKSLHRHKTRRRIRGCSLLRKSQESRHYHYPIALIMVTFAQLMVVSNLAATVKIVDDRHLLNSSMVRNTMQQAANLEPNAKDVTVDNNWPPLTRDEELLLEEVTEGEDRSSQQSNDDEDEDDSLVSHVISNVGGHHHKQPPTNVVRTSKQLKKLLARPRQILSSFVPYTLSKQLVLKRPNNLMMTMNLTKRIHDKLQSSSGSSGGKPLPAALTAQHRHPFHYQNQQSYLHQTQPFSPHPNFRHHQSAIPNLRILNDRPHSNGFLAVQVKPLMLQPPHRNPAMVNQQIDGRYQQASNRYVMVNKVPMLQHGGPRNPPLPAPMIEQRPQQVQGAVADEDDSVTEEELVNEGQEGGGLRPQPGGDEALVQFDQLIRDEFETRLNLNEQIMQHQRATTGSRAHNTSGYNLRPAHHPRLSLQTGKSLHELVRYRAANNGSRMVTAQAIANDRARKLQQHHQQSATETKRHNLPAPSATAHFMHQAPSEEQPFVPTALETIAHLMMNNGSSASGSGAGANGHNNLQTGGTATELQTTNDNKFPPSSSYNQNTKVPSPMQLQTQLQLQHHHQQQSDKANKLSNQNNFVGESGPGNAEQLGGSYHSPNTIRQHPTVVEDAPSSSSNNFYLQVQQQQRRDNSILDHRPSSSSNRQRLPQPTAEEDPDNAGAKKPQTLPKSPNLYQLPVADSHIEQIISPQQATTAATALSKSSGTNQRQRKGTAAANLQRLQLLSEYRQRLTPEQLRSLSEALETASGNNNNAEPDDADSGGDESSAAALGETLIRLHETKTRIRQLQAELNATGPSGPSLFNSAMRRRQPPTFNLHANDNNNNNNSRSSTVHHLDDDRYENQEDDEEDAPGDMSADSQDLFAGGKQMGASNEWFQLWSPSSDDQNVGDQFRQLNASSGVLIRAQNSMNLPMAMYHAGGPLTAPARLVASAFGRAAKGSGSQSTVGKPIIVRTQNGRWSVFNELIANSNTGQHEQTPAPVLLASSLLVDGQEQLSPGSVAPPTAAQVKGERARQPPIGDDQEAIMNGKQLSGTKLLPASHLQQTPNNNNNLTLLALSQQQLWPGDSAKQQQLSPQLLNHGNNGTTMKQQHHTTTDTFSTNAGERLLQPENQTSSHITMTTALTGNGNTKQQQQHGNGSGDGGGEESVAVVDPGADNSTQQHVQVWDANSRRRFKEQLATSLAANNYSSHHYQHHQLKPLKFEPIQQSTDLSQLVTSATTTSTTGGNQHQQQQHQVARKPSGNFTLLSSIIGSSNGGASPSNEGGKQWSAMVGFDGASVGRGSDRRRSDQGGNNGRSNQAEASESNGFFGQLLGKLFNSFSSTTGQNSTKTTATRQTMQVNNATLSTTSQQQQQPKLTTEKVLHTLIAFSCSLAILCLIVVVATVRCQTRRRKRASSNSSSSQSSAGISNNDHRPLNGNGKHSSSRGLDAAWRRLSGSNQTSALAVASDRYTQHDKLILDGTMRNISLIARRGQIAPVNQAASISVKMPQPTLNSSCCHCVSCSESWLFRDESTDKQSNGRRQVCSSGFYHPAPRGKLPFGAASSVNKLLRSDSDHASSAPHRHQHTAASTTRHPIGGTRLKMMSAIDEDVPRCASPAQAVLLLANHDDGDDDGLDGRLVGIGEEGCTCNKYQSEDEDADHEEVCEAPGACCRQQQHGCQLAGKAASSDKLATCATRGVDNNNESCCAASNRDNTECTCCNLNEGGQENDDEKSRSKLIGSKRVNSSDITSKSAMHNLDSINVNELAGCSDGVSSGNERVVTTSAKNSSKGSSSVVNCETNASSNLRSLHHRQQDINNASNTKCKTIEEEEEQQLQESSSSGAKATSEVDTKGAPHTPIKSKSNSRLLLFHPLVQRFRDRNSDGSSSGEEVKKSKAVGGHGQTNSANIDVDRAGQPKGCRPHEADK